MEYKKDKRTKNLTLRDIHVGDWVQVWSETTELEEYVNSSKKNTVAGRINDARDRDRY